MKAKDVMTHMRARWGLSFAAAIAIAVAAGLVAYAWHPAIPPVQHRQAAAFNQTLIAKGSELSLVGNCNACHTHDGGASYAGGRPIPTSFGTIYSTNITQSPS